MAAIIQPEVIDVTSWPIDPEHATYPEGAREKRAIFPPDSLPFPFLKPGRRYLFKLSDDRYPEQFWAEIVAYHVGDMLGVSVPPAYAAYDGQKGDCGAIIEWFFVDGEHVFVAGGNFLQRLMPEYDRKRGTHHSWFLINRVCRRLSKSNVLQADWQRYWGRVLVFDVLIGNTDRHQDNWGFLIAQAPAEHPVTLCPAFDNGTSLGMERHLEHVRAWDDARVETFIGKGNHHMKWQSDDGKRGNHFGLLAQWLEAHPAERGHLSDMLNGFSLTELEATLNALSGLALPVPLLRERISFIMRLTTVRYNRLRALLA